MLVIRHKRFIKLVRLGVQIELVRLGVHKIFSKHLMGLIAFIVEQKRLIIA